MFRDIQESKYIAIRQLSPLVHPPTEGLVGVIVGYYDGSNSAGLIGLGAYIAPLKAWERFESEWIQVLNGRVHGVHMQDLYVRDEAFAGVTADVAMQIADDCVSYLSGLHDWSFRRYSCIVKIDDFKRAQLHAPRLADKSPEAVCVDHCVGRLFSPRFREEDDPERNIELYFDGNERFCYKINRVFQRRRKHKHLWWTKYVRLITPVDNSDNAVIPLQAADVLAWVARRFRADGNPDSGKHRDWHVALCGDKPQQTSSHEFFDYDALMAKYGPGMRVASPRGPQS